MHRLRVFSALLVLIAGALGGCRTASVSMVDVEDFINTEPIAASADQALLAAGDVIQISVEVAGRLEVPQHTGTVNQQGLVTLPLVGDVPVGGLRVSDARQVIAQRYGTYYVTRPVVMLTLASQSRSGEWGEVLMTGRVQNPGPVALPSGSGLRLSAAVQASGGFSPSAKTSEVKVTRVDRSGRKIGVVIDFNEIGQSGNAQADITLMDGDIVYVPQRIL